MQIDDRSAVAARFISLVHGEIQRAFAAASKKGLTQQALASKLGVNRATVNKRLQGLDNLTLRSISDLAWALGREPGFALNATDFSVNEPTFSEPTVSVTTPLGGVTIPSSTSSAPSAIRISAKSPEFV
jgi:transcriptional regulator with XRE-family HTH domain